MHNATTFTHFNTAAQRRCPDASGNFTALLNDVATACKVIAHYVRCGALGGVLGSAGSENVQGEVQKKLDILSNEVMLRSLEWTGHITAMASEEMEDIYPVKDPHPRGGYLVLFDPLDGSSNIDVNVSVGTIFSVLRAPNGNAEVSLEDFLQAGATQVAAGYVLYGPATMLVLTTGDGVNGFTLDPGAGEYLLTHSDIRIPADTGEFAINASNQRFWEPPMQHYVDDLLAGRQGPRGRDFNMRWVGSMVAEVHRILTRGGLFTYPRDTKDPKKAGRLRLMYEANPMSFIIEQAGGASSTGRRRILDLQPEGLHQRVPVVLGSRNEVAMVESYYADSASAA